MMITEPIGLYVHIPFCKSKCNYCDFVSFANLQNEYEDKYVDALIDEISEYSAHEKIPLDTLFFGGGTPSVISSHSFERIVNAIRKSFNILPSAEFTIEANPKTLTGEKLSLYTSLGVNRISLGLQSIHENELEILGRIHSFEEFLESYSLCQEHGISNVNVDLMYAIPEQTVDSFTNTLRKIISISPTHISAYSLILEEGTCLYKKKDLLNFPTEDEECEMYYKAADILRDAGYSHYEISNYALEGYECRHNLKYWQNKEYIGLGLAAHSYLGKKRYSNPVVFSEYFSAKRKEYRQTESIDISTNAYEYVMTHLRLAQGFSLLDYERKFGCSFISGRESLLSDLEKSGYLKCSDGRISLTEKGFYVSNTVISELI